MATAITSERAALLRRRHERTVEAPNSSQVRAEWAEISLHRKLKGVRIRHLSVATRGKDKDLRLTVRCHPEDRDRVPDRWMKLPVEVVSQSNMAKAF